MKNLENVGEQWDVKNVADGYAMNFLIPRGLAIPATLKTIAEANRKKGELIKSAEADLAKVQQLAASLGDYEITIPVKASAEGTLYAGITAKIISDALLKQGFHVPVKYVKLVENIHSLGEYQILLAFDHGLEATIKVIVEPVQQDVLIEN